MQHVKVKSVRVQRFTRQMENNGTKITHKTSTTTNTQWIEWYSFRSVLLPNRCMCVCVALSPSIYKQLHLKREFMRCIFGRRSDGLEHSHFEYWIQMLQFSAFCFVVLLDFCHTHTHTHLARTRFDSSNGDCFDFGISFRWPFNFSLPFENWRFLLHQFLLWLVFDLFRGKLPFGFFRSVRLICRFRAFAIVCVFAHIWSSAAHSANPSGINWKQKMIS